MDNPEELRLQVQTVTDRPKRHPPRRPYHVCRMCWATITPLAGHTDLIGGFGHRSDCPDRGIDLNLDDLAGRWLYAEPFWSEPVVLCEACGAAAADELGDDENVTIVPAGEVSEWDWLQWLYEHPATSCWRCGAPLPEVRQGAP